ncbi:MAG: PPOX class F420-dependent oxidoreductase [Actinobacteria bacterium]|nr:PPOX class F420-dependent oxidoreductase [Actinomycetota bacterium]
MSLADEKYLVLTTFRRDGTPVPTTVWAVPLDDGKIGLWTSSGSGKAKRLAHTEAVTIQPCDARGRVTAGSEPSDAVAHLVDGAEFAAIQAKVRAKYGFMTKLTKLLNSIGGTLKRNRVPYGDRGIVITPST